jgi:GxxExxY protein
MNLIYNEQTEKLIGAIFKVFQTLGYGYQEKEYQKAYAEELKIQGVKFSRELYSNLTYNGKIIRRYFIDFLVEFGEIKIVVELKVANDAYQQHFNQVLQYLKNYRIRLGLIFVITPRQVIIKRVINDTSAHSAQSVCP